MNRTLRTAAGIAAGIAIGVTGTLTAQADLAHHADLHRATEAVVDVHVEADPRPETYLVTLPVTTLDADRAPGCITDGWVCVRLSGTAVIIGYAPLTAFGRDA